MRTLQIFLLSLVFLWCTTLLRHSNVNSGTGLPLCILERFFLKIKQTKDFTISSRSLQSYWDAIVFILRALFLVFFFQIFSGFQYWFLNYHCCIIMYLEGRHHFIYKCWKWIVYYWFSSVYFITSNFTWTNFQTTQTKFTNCLLLKRKFSA